MGINYNGTVLPPGARVLFGGQEVQRVFANGTLVWQRRADLYRNGTTALAGAWVAQNGIWVDPNTGKITNLYGANMNTMLDQGTQLYCDANVATCGGIRSGNRIPWAKYQGMTCRCEIDIYLRGWGYEEYKWDSAEPYAWVQLWAAADAAIGAAPIAVSSFRAPRGLDDVGQSFWGSNGSALYHYRRTLSFPCPEQSGFLYLTLGRSVKAYTRFETATIWIE